MSEPQMKKKKPNYYMHKRRKQYILEPGLKGFLCTCNFREKECIREAYNILNLYADQLKSTTSENADKIEENADKIEENAKEDSDSDDIADELSKEINEFRNEKPAKKRFQVVESGAKNILFIRTTVENPTEIVSAVIDDILTTQTQKTRYLLRLLPIESTCKANMDDIKNCISILVDQHFSGEPKTFAVAFNHRNNNQINREDIINEVPAIVNAKNSNHKVDLKNPDLTIIVEVIRGMCLLSVVPFYNKLKKYNLIQLFESVNKNTEPGSTENETKENDSEAVEKSEANN